MRLGLFGGTFDPIHLGHLDPGRAVPRELCVSTASGLWWPASRRTSAATERRWLIDSRWRGSRWPATRRSRSRKSRHTRPGPHYSVETLESVRRERPDDELFFLIGADSLNDLPGWREPGRIAKLATIVVVNRPGIEEADPARVTLTSAHGARPILSVTIPPIGIASTDLRRRVREGRSIRYMVPRGVEAYIEAQGLYR